MKTYIIERDGVALHYAGAIDGKAVYGWGGQCMRITPGPGPVVVEFTTREEAQDWIDRRAVFCGGAVVAEKIGGVSPVGA